MEVEVEEERRCSSDQQEEGVQVSLPGFRFHPTDEELVGFYLRRKVEEKPLSVELIKQIDIYKYDPWDLPKVSSIGDKEWYFFCRRGRKYRNSIRPNRVTGSGFWKATGIDRPIYPSSGDHSRPNQFIGLKKSLVYYKGSAGKGSKTDWMMHEFRLPPPSSDKSKPKNSQEAEVWTLCRIFKRVSSHRKYALDWKANPSMKQQIQTVSTPKSCSLESDGRRGNCYSRASQTETKASVINFEDQKQTISGHWCSTVTSPGRSIQDLGDQNGFHATENWDELGAVVEYALDRTGTYPCIWL